MKKFRRRTRLFITGRFQIRYISLILFFMFMTAVLAGYTVYVTTWVMFGEKLAAVYPQGLLLDIVKQVNMVLFLRLILLSPLVIFIGLVLSNRIAGPIYRIQKFLQKVSNGRYKNDLELREKDELQDLAGSLNLLVSKLRSERQGREKTLDAVKRDMGELETAVMEGGHDGKRLLEKIVELRENIDKFSVHDL
ncbi:MAG: hypothetical protein DRP85_06660 [Candidatus Makaraimicrobium thalassicum]|nr:MAG: hypothetical protein DRP85_06660 [Candidatus Omnitrophota bacterium]